MQACSVSFFRVNEDCLHLENNLTAFLSENSRLEIMSCCVH